MRTHNLFISHSWSYSDSYNRLVALLRGRAYFRYRNYSVPRDNPIHGANTPDRKLRMAIRQRMQPCSIVLVLAGVYSSYGRWIDIEMRLAESGFDNCKPIIAVEPWGSQKTSYLVKQSASKVVRWNTDSVVAAIRELT